MCKKYRIVSTFWNPRDSNPFVNDFFGAGRKLYPTPEAAQAAVEDLVKLQVNSMSGVPTDFQMEKGFIEDPTHNYRGDLSGDHDGIVRFWDGDAYCNVTAYNVHEISCDSDDLSKCSYFKYRGLWILPNEAHTSFAVQKFDMTLDRCASLNKALLRADSFLLSYPGFTVSKSHLDSSKTYDTPINKDSLISTKIASNDSVYYIPCKYVSCWDGFGEVSSSAKYDPATNRVYDVELADLSDEELAECEILSGEYVDLLKSRFSLNERSDDDTWKIEDPRPLHRALHLIEMSPKSPLQEQISSAETRQSNSGFESPLKSKESEHEI